MKLKFYDFDRETGRRGRCAGSAELTAQGLVVRARDPLLERMLKAPYVVRRMAIKDGMAVRERISFLPGTHKHLRALATDSYKFGYMAEIQDPGHKDG